MGGEQVATNEGAFEHILLEPIQEELLTRVAEAARSNPFEPPDRASIPARESQVQQLVDRFKEYAARANEDYRTVVDQKLRQREEERRQLQAARAKEERRLRILERTQV